MVSKRKLSSPQLDISSVPVTDYNTVKFGTARVVEGLAAISEGGAGNANQSRIAEGARACAVMALGRIPYSVTFRRAVNDCVIPAWYRGLKGTRRFCALCWSL